MTHTNTSPESCSGKMNQEDIKDRPVESKSGNRDQEAFQSLIDGLSPSERDGVRKALDEISKWATGIEQSENEANFPRARGICAGMLKALNEAHRAILVKFPSIKEDF